MIILPKVPASRLKGLVPKDKHSRVSLEKIDSSIAEDAVRGMQRRPLRCIEFDMNIIVC